MGEDKAGWTDREFFRGNGCDDCRHTGYQGRIAVYELLPMYSEVKHLVLKREPTHLIRSKAVELGMTTLRQDGFSRILEGVTTFEEIRRVAQEEEVYRT